MAWFILLAMNVWEAEILEAISSHCTEKAVDLVRQGFPINYSVKIRDQQGAVQPGFSTLLIEAVLAQNLNFAQFLLRSGINPNTIDSKGRHPALLAAASGNVELAVLLLSNHCNFSARDALGNTVLHAAATECQVEMVCFLVERLNFPVIVTNKMMQKPVDCCKAQQDQGTTLTQIEKLEEVIQYLWKKEEEFKRKSKQDPLKILKISKNHRLCRPQRLANDDETFPITIAPSKTLTTSLSPLRTRQTIQSYLTGKHAAIFRSLEESVTLARMSKGSTRSPTPGIKLPKIKKTPLTSQSNY
jgi:hypothetical protein